MSGLRTLLGRLRGAGARLLGLFHGPSDDRAMREEMEFHLEQLAASHRRAGLSAEEAWRRARLEFGGVPGHEEAARESLRNRLLEDVVRDLRYGARSLRRHPGFGVAAVLTIGMGIAAAVTVFTIVDSIYLRPLPLPNSSRFVEVGFRPPGGRLVRPGRAAADLVRSRIRAFDAVAAHDSREVLYVQGHGSAAQRFGAFVSPEYFGLLGLTPYLGRFFLPAEDSVPDRDAVVVLSYDLWRTQFAADSSVLGRRIQVRSRDAVVVGVAPPGFSGLSVGGAPNELWMPTMMLGVMGQTCVGRPGCRETGILARLAPAATLADAEHQVAELGRQLGTLAYGRDTLPRTAVVPIRGMADDQRSTYASLPPLLGGIAFLLIVIACVNVAGLLLTRGLSRGGEVSLRFSLGASRGRIVRQLLAENLLIGLAGGLIGVLLSVAAARTLMGFFAVDSEAFPHFFFLSLDGRVVAFAAAASIVAVALFGVLPALATSRQGLLQQAGTFRITGRGRGRLGLMGAQVALSIALLTGAGLMAHSFARLRYAQRFDADHVALLRLRPGMLDYDPPRAQGFLRAALSRIDALPNVTGVAYGRGIGYLWTEGPVSMPLGHTPADTVGLVYPRFVSPGFLATLGIPLLAGREFTATDTAGAPLVAVVTASAARMLAPTGDVLDQTMVLGGKTFRIVGVAPDFVVHPIRDPIPSLVLVPFWEMAFQPEVDARLAVRVRGDPVAALPALRRAVNAADPAVPVTEMMPMARQVDLDYTPVHLGMVVLAAAAATALLLTGLGLYGVIAYLVARRTREIGLRIALGARSGEVVGLMLRQGVAPTVAGVLAGVVIAFAAGRLLAAFLIGVQPLDPVAYGMAVGAVGGVAALATYLPARWAARVDPMTALRVE